MMFHLIKLPNEIVTNYRTHVVTMVKHYIPRIVDDTLDFKLRSKRTV